MAHRIALRCPHCRMVSHRPMGFVRAKAHFVCNYCLEMVPIDRHQRTLALARHEPVMDAENALEPASAATDGRHR